MISREVRRKRLNIVQDAVKNPLAGIASQLEQKASDPLTKSCSLGPLRAVIQPYLQFSLALIEFQVISQRSAGFVSLIQEETLFEPYLSLQRSDGTKAATRNLSPEVHGAILFLSCSMMENPSDVISHSSLYSLRHEWSLLDNYLFQRGCLSLLFATLLKADTKAPNIVRPQPPQVKVTEIYKARNAVMRSDSRPVLTSSYTNLSLLFFAAG